MEASKDSGPKTIVPKTKVEVPLNTRAKYVAAENAHYLIRRWTTKRPTQSANGPYFSLARLLYEAATAIKPTTLDRVSMANAANSPESGAPTRRVSGLNRAACRGRLAPPPTNPRTFSCWFDGYAARGSGYVLVVCTPHMRCINREENHVGRFGKYPGH